MEISGLSEYGCVPGTTEIRNRAARPRWQARLARCCSPSACSDIPNFMGASFVSSPNRRVACFPQACIRETTLDEWPVLAVADFCNLPSGIAFDFPDRRRRIASDHQEQAAKCRILGHMRLGQLVLSLPGSRLDNRNPLLCAERMQAAGECACHLAQMLVIQLRVVPVQVSPPAAHAATGLPHREKGIEDNAIYAIVDTLQQLGVILGKIIGRVHTRSLARSTPSLVAVRESEPPFSSEIWKRA